MTMQDCVFCKITKGEIPAKKVMENSHIFAFEDINPSTETHILIVPKVHIDNIESVKEEDCEVIGKMVSAIQTIVKEKNPSEYRVIVNGRNYLEVNHLHWHLQIGKLTKHALERLIDANSR